MGPEANGTYLLTTKPELTNDLPDGWTCYVNKSMSKGVPHPCVIDCSPDSSIIVIRDGPVLRTSRILYVHANNDNLWSKMSWRHGIDPAPSVTFKDESVLSALY